MTLPDRLSAALSSHRPRSGDLEHLPTGRKIIQRGDIRQVAPCSDPNDAMRLALVLDEDHERSSVEIMLVHPYVELATETDLVFAPDETGAPYPVVVETRVRSAVWTYQVERSSKRVGGLPAEVLEEIGKVAAADDPFVVSPRTGPPLAGPADSRWNFKKQEIKVLNQLAADRISAVFEDRPILKFDDMEELLKSGALDPDISNIMSNPDIGLDHCNIYQSQINESLAHA